MIIVTGASGGLGNALVRGLAQEDVVVGTYWRTKPEVDGPVQMHRVDVTDPASIAAFLKDVKSIAKRIVLVNLAGIAVDRLAISMPLTEWNDVLRVNLTGTFLMSQAVLPLMMRQRWGRIINITSVVTELGTPGTAAYAAAKGALLPFTRVLAREYGRYNVTANCIDLGYFDAGLIAQVSADAREALLQRTPVGRFGRADDLLEAVRYLIRAEFTTGSSLPLTGGLA